MLEFLSIFIVGKYFYRLAENHQENKWLYAIISGFVYYFGIGIGGLFLGLFFAVAHIDFNWNNNFINSLIAIPFGFGADYLFYIILRKMWTKKENAKDEINAIGTDDLDL
jgi:hypothetical protein